jgi:hypothetical protein
VSAPVKYTLWAVTADRPEPVSLATGSRAYVNAERRRLTDAAERSDGAMPYPRRTFTVTRKGMHPGRSWVQTRGARHGPRLDDRRDLLDALPSEP